MGSILKALGLTIWGLVAFGLVAIFIFVGYEAALRYRTPSSVKLEESTPSDQLKQGQLSQLDTAGSSTPSERTVPNASVLAGTPDATRKLFLNAAKNRQYGAAIRYGQQLVDGNSAAPAELSIVAQSYASIGDCANAQVWAERAKDAFQAAGLEPDVTLRRLTPCCTPVHVALDAAQLAHVDQLLSETNAAKSDSGAPFVRLGELYYGFGEYELAIASIEHGLEKGRIARLDEAYVYLGLAEQAIGHLEEARNAFNNLKTVPGINPRVLRLWTLYAETQLSTTSESASENGQCPKVGAS